MNVLHALRAERSASLETLRRLGPDAPTLCHGWTTQDIAAHLVIQDAGAGIPIAIMAPFGLASLRFGWRWVSRFAEHAQDQADKEGARGWEHLLGRLDGGPPAAVALPVFGPTRFHENWVHHEDMRRANGEEPRPRSETPDDLLWRAIPFYANYQQGQIGSPLILRSENRQDRRIGKPTSDPVVVSGAPGEIALVLTGRGQSAEADVTGPEQAVRGLRSGLHQL